MRNDHKPEHCRTPEHLGKDLNTLISVTSGKGASGEGGPFPFTGELDRVVITLTD